MSMNLARPTDDGTPVEDQIVVLHDATWRDYERLLEIRGDRSAPRIAFLEGELELKSPSKTHESIKSRIGQRYREIPTSRVLPGIDLVQLVTFLALPTSEAIHAYRAALKRR